MSTRDTKNFVKGRSVPFPSFRIPIFSSVPTKFVKPDKVTKFCSCNNNQHTILKKNSQKWRSFQMSTCAAGISIFGMGKEI